MFYHVGDNQHTQNIQVNKVIAENVAYFLPCYYYSIPFWSPFDIKMVTQKFTFHKFFLMHADMTAVTTQSNKIGSNEVKDH